MVLSLESLSVKGNAKDFVFHVGDSSPDEAPGKKASPQHPTKVPAPGGMASPGLHNNAHTITGAYSKWKTGEVQLACVLNGLSARIMPTITAEHVLRQVDVTASNFSGNVAQ